MSLLPVEHYRTHPHAAPGVDIQWTLQGPNQDVFTFSNARKGDLYPVYFDLHCRQTPEDGSQPAIIVSLGELATNEETTIFTVDNRQVEPIFWYEAHGPLDIIGLNLGELATPEGVLSVGHELGHAHQWEVTNAVLAHAALDKTPADDIARQLENYGPIPSWIVTSVNRTPGLKEKLIEAFELWERHPYFAGPTELEMTPQKWLLNIKDYLEAAYLLSALQEAFAWRTALNFIDQGHLRPGLSRVAMRHIIHRWAYSYDKSQPHQGPGAHVEALAHALDKNT